ncbi:peptidylprolyl isomerase [Pelomonas sp. SE-A7]|uniref:peptidylprolyl isomerase n=1 Tax=Pelomonas sp. SE-A7 TaxID=3054953 RepID=UPI00259CFEB9|nr:peptidylprolyl isomerase [Pelomonas sp. SE-A7]MDM4766972.1 peptidylprolyl isomerase [Pelomonas sp. SE-A7]
MTDRPVVRSLALAAALCAALGSAPALAQGSIRPGDQIAAVVNNDVVAASEVLARIQQIREEARRKGDIPDPEEIRKQAMEALILERVLVTNAREAGAKVDEPELDRVVANVAVQNKMSMEQLRERLKADGMDYRRFREQLRDQMLMERVREAEVQKRIKISDSDVDRYLEEQQEKANSNPQLNIGQVLISVPEGASDQVVAERKAKAEAALARLKAGEDFGKVARELSEDSFRDKGGEIGLRQAERLPDLLVEAVKGLKTGELRPTVLRSPSGFHVLKMIERQAPTAANQVTQTRARHVLLRPSAQLTNEVAAQRLAEYKRQIESGSAKFEDIARQNSEDGSAEQGGDLGWVAPGVFVPEFEEAMNALPLKGISAPVPSRFGVHLIQVLERKVVELELKQMREQARGALRERKYDEAYQEWVKELRAKAFVEMREWAL